MWTCRVPEPGYKPRAKPMRQQIMFDVPAGLSTDEIKQVFRCLADDPQQRLPARHLRFFNPVTLTTNPIQVPRERLDPALRRAGARRRSSARASRRSSRRSRPTPPSSSASSSPRQAAADHRPSPRQRHRRARSDRQQPARHPQVAERELDRRRGGSTNGTYVDHTYERRKTVNLMHGGEVQLGELRFKLVSFAKDSVHHRRARVLPRQAGRAHGPPHARPAPQALEEEAAFADWVEAPLSIARYELRGPNRLVSDRPTILEMLALRRAATRVVELTDMLLLSLIAVTAGRTGPLRFFVAMVGPGQQEARNLVEQVVGQVRG